MRQYKYCNIIMFNSLGFTDHIRIGFNVINWSWVIIHNIKRENVWCHHRIGQTRDWQTLFWTLIDTNFLSKIHRIGHVELSLFGLFCPKLWLTLYIFVKNKFKNDNFLVFYSVSESTSESEVSRVSYRPRLLNFLGCL